MCVLYQLAVLAAAVSLVAARVYTDEEKAEQLHKLYRMGALERRAYKTALSRLVSAASKQPEYVDPKVLAHIDQLRSDYAKKNHIPSKSRKKLLKVLGVEPDAVAILVGEEVVRRTGQDTEMAFRQESNFMYATGFDHPGAKVVIGLDPNHPILPAGDAWLFVPKRDPVWVGLEETLDDYLQKYDVTKVSWLDDFVETVDKVIRPISIKTFSGVNVWGSAAPPPCAEIAEHDQYSLRAAFASARVTKLPEELEMIRAATRLAVESHETLMQHITCGMWESDAESLFRFVGHNYGARFQSYIPIVGAGPNSAALHYNDGESRLAKGSIMLVDAAPEIGQTRNGGGYTSDVTRTWPCSGTYTKEQAGVYRAVYAAQNGCISSSVVGGSMTSAVEASNRGLLQGLLDIGVLHNGNVDDMLKARIHSLFQPHGLGHSVGLDVHDPGNLNPFKPGTVITCEPGCYFYPSLLDPAYDNPDQGKYLNKKLIEEKYIHMGGVRIEDVIHISDKGPENFSGDLPRSVEEIEAFLRGNKRAVAGNALGRSRANE